jgi:hypothetical protein
MGRKERFERGLARVDESLDMMWSAFRRRYPDASPQQLHIEWVRVQFGDELAARIEDFLSSSREHRDAIRRAMKPVAQFWTRRIEFMLSLAQLLECRTVTGGRPLMWMY